MNKPIKITPKIKDLIGLDLKKNKKILDDFTKLVQQVGFLKADLDKIEIYWNTLELNFKEYEKIPLIYKYEDMFDKIEEDQNTLKALKDSEFYDQIQTKVTEWEKKLSLLQIVLGLNMDIQRQWL